MPADADAAPLQNLAADRAGKHQGGSQASGKMTAAADVVEAVIMQIGGIIGMPGARHIQQIAVVLGPGVGVFNYGAERSAGCGVVEKTAHHLWKIALLARGRGLVLPRRAAFHLREDRIHIDRFPGRQAVDHNADGNAMAFPKDGNADHFTPC